MDRPTAPTLEEAYAGLTDDEKMTDLGAGVKVKDIYNYLQNNQRKQIIQFVKDRFTLRYLLPFEKVERENNSGFAQMAICCLMIEAMESFRHGWDDTSRDAKRSNRTRKPGGEIFEDFFNRYDEFTDLRGLGNDFYSNVRCGILHQAESQNGWLIVREGKLFDTAQRKINSTKFRKSMKKCLKEYCKELEAASENSDVWDGLEKKLAHIIKNCHKGECLS